MIGRETGLAMTKRISIALAEATQNPHSQVGWCVVSALEAYSSHPHLLVTVERRERLLKVPLSLVS